jgi:hypothetical protein
MTLEYPIICWWSGGVTSAIACKKSIELFGLNNCRIVFIDVKNEDEDTYRFKNDCEMFYNKPIESISNEDYEDIKKVWYKFLSLNVAHGAICSSELKRIVRVRFQKTNPYSYQTFGFHINESKRAFSLALNYSDSKPIFPNLLFGLSKLDCVDILQKCGIEIPRVYKWGFSNNNCFKTGCVQGGIGYWQKMQKEFYDKFYDMAMVEHDLTNLAGKPVTILKDQSKGGGLVFLLPHPQYPHIKDISMMKGRMPEPLVECNGFCGTYDLIN